MGAETDNLASERPYVVEFEAEVADVDGQDVTLDQTYFYAEGGGQPADRGSLAGVDVVDVQAEDGRTVHTLADKPDLSEGDTVEGRVDEAFRTYCMRAHTASHVIYGAGRRLLDADGYGGFDIGPDTVRIDFETDDASDRPNALSFQRLANEAVWESYDVEWYEMETERAREDDDVVFNLDQDVAAADTVRIVEIEDWDVAACGGTHVRNTNEIGPVKVTDVSNPGSDLVRVEYAVGQEAIQRQVDETRAAKRAADSLDTGVTDLPARAESLLEENRSLREERNQLQERLLDAQFDALRDDAVSKDGANWIVGEVEAADSNAVSEEIDGLVGEAADVVALAGGDGTAFVVVGTTGDVDAGDVVDDVTGEFGGGGGGRPTLAQGGGIDADPGDVVEFLRTEY